MTIPSLDEMIAQSGAAKPSTGGTTIRPHAHAPNSAAEPDQPNGSTTAEQEPEPEPKPADPHGSTAVDPILRGFEDRARALPDGAVGKADELMAEIAESKLDPIAFRRIADVIAKVTRLDASEIRKKLFHARAAREGAASDTSDSGDTETAPPTTPAPLARVLDAAALMLRRQVSCTETSLYAAVLWTAGTYGYHEAEVFPRLVFTSETSNCGKTTALKTVEILSFNPRRSDNISAAAMFRLVASQRMSLFIDEFDSFGRDNEDVRNVLNAGYLRTGTVTRVEPTDDGKGWTPVEYPCFCPVAIAGIGGLPETVRNRSIVNRLQRAPKGRARQMRLRELLKLRRQIVPHLIAHADAIAAAIKDGAKNLPLELDARVIDNWDPLIAVAELAGGDWPARALAAAREFSGEGYNPTGYVEKLVDDIRWMIQTPARHRIEAWREWFHAKNQGGPRPTKTALPTEIRSAELLTLLHKMPHRPWQEAGKGGKPITERWLADRLDGLDVKPYRKRIPSWPFDGNGEPATIPGNPIGRGTNPYLHVYSIADLRAVCDRYR
jgi:hypothetical protein